MGQVPSVVLQVGCSEEDIDEIFKLLRKHLASEKLKEIKRFEGLENGGEIKYKDFKEEFNLKWSYSAYSEYIGNMKIISDSNKQLNIYWKSDYTEKVKIFRSAMLVIQRINSVIENFKTKFYVSSATV